jgi:hypothetical protein
VHIFQDGLFVGQDVLPCRDGHGGRNDVSLWGGIVINGNVITNNSTDAERRPTSATSNPKASP